MCIERLRWCARTSSKHWNKSVTWTQGTILTTPDQIGDLWLLASFSFHDTYLPTSPPLTHLLQRTSEMAYSPFKNKFKVNQFRELQDTPEITEDTCGHAETGPGKHCHWCSKSLCYTPMDEESRGEADTANTSEQAQTGWEARKYLPSWRISFEEWGHLATRAFLQHTRALGSRREYLWL